MSEQKVAPYGTWESPITSDLIVAGAKRFGLCQIDGESLYWQEGRPTEDGRQAIVRWQPGGELSDIIPMPYNARTRVHEYGGGDYLVVAGTLYFAEYSDQRLYQMVPGQTTPTPLTPAAPYRYADMIADPTRRRLLCIREDHTGAPAEAINSIVALDLTQETAGKILVSGNDFYASPRLSPDGQRLAWLTWNHPNMPWDGTELWLADIAADGSLANAQHVAGGAAESIFQPEWSPDGVLTFVADSSGWWNLYRWQNGRIQPLYPLDAEFGRPQWKFGMTTYGYISAAEIICTYQQQGGTVLARLQVDSGKLTPIDLPYSDIRALKTSADRILFLGGMATEPTAVVCYDLRSQKLTTLARESTVEMDPGYLSLPQAIEFPTENSLTAHAYFYPPQNDDFVAPNGELPPLIVMSHGGPTGATSARFNLNIQFWTSRGFGVVDVNYGGSTGYGRAYRQRLHGTWGIVDVQDCVNAARFLAAQGKVDGNRLAIRGGSAGGYTTLCALAFTDLFHAGASYYGVSDAEALARETHKFESRYLDNLIGPYPARKDLYEARSPIHFTRQINTPLLLLQGLEDKVVPPNQSEKMFKAVRASEVPVAYVDFPGEAHGFRKAESQKKSLESELYFYGRVLGFGPETAVPPIHIENL